MIRIFLNRLCVAALLVLAFSGSRAFAQADGFWNQSLAGTYSWDNATNWAAFPGGYPNGTNDGARFTGVTTGAITITTTGTSGTITVNRLVLETSTAHNIGFNGMSLTFADPGSQAPTLTMGLGLPNPPFGENRINTPVVIGTSSLTVSQTNTVNNLRISGVISGGLGSSGLTKTGGGLLILDGNNTYTGTTTISGGILQIGNGGSSGTLAGPVTNNAILRFNRSDTGLVFSSNITGSGSLEHTGSGRVTLTGTNSYSGGTTVSAGTLQIGSGTSGSITGDITNNATVSFGRSDDTTYAGTISGSGGVTIEGGGIMRFTAIHGYTGATTIASGSTLHLGDGVTDGSVANAGGIVNNGSLFFNRTVATPSYSGAISGSGSVTKLGGNTLTLDGANTYTGATTVSAGTLIFGADAIPSSSSRITVASGATVNLTAEPYVVGHTLSQNQRLEGRGTVQASTLTVQGIGANSGVIAPGIQGGSETVGTMNIQGKMTFASGGTYEVSYNKLTGTFAAGTDNDLLESTILADTLDISATSGAPFRLRMNYTGTEEHSSGDKQLMIAKFAGGITNFAADKFVLEGDFAGPGTFQLQLMGSGTELWLTFTPVPEPTTVLGIAALGLAGLGYLRRRRT